MANRIFGFGKRQHTASQRRKQGVTVAISFVLAVTLWFLVTLNLREFESEFTIPLTLTNKPPMVELREEFPRQVRITARGKGIDLITQYFRSGQDTIEIDFNRYFSEQRFDCNRNLVLFDNYLDPGVKSVHIRPDSLPLSYYARETKRVPVVLSFDLPLSPSYMLTEEIHPKPDSVTVMGPKEALDTLKQWGTMRVDFSHKVTGDTQFFVALDTTHRPFYPVQKDVRVKVKTERFTEDQRTVKVAPVNLPQGYHIRFFPDTVCVKYLVPLRSFETAKGEAVSLTVDCAHIDPTLQSLIPRISALPSGARAVLVSPPALKYIVTKDPK